jgi:hypothetical protein
MSIDNSRVPAALSGIIGPVILVASFLINPAPPADSTTSQLRDFAVRHHGGIVLGGWLQGMGSLLIVLFALALVHLANATHRLEGWVTLLAGASILMVSLVEITLAHVAYLVETAPGVSSGGHCPPPDLLRL